MCKNCLCSIVPPNVLSGLAKNGSLASKKTLADLNGLVQKRKITLALITRIEIVEGNADRYIYDSQNTWELRKLLVRKEGNASISDGDVNSIYDISGFMRSYLKDIFNHNSLDNNGMDLLFNVHYRSDYNNAFWDGDEMAFGDGDGRNFIGFANSIDVIAHELMHGVTQFLANLQYYSQSGALNEHFSDVFGSIIKQRILNQSPQDADWLIGNDVIGPEFPGVALRSMSNPGTANDFDIQPDHMDNYYNGTDDNQGVHINSGIPNKAFYLATIILGIDVTEVIWFETLKRLWATSNFEDMLDVILEVTSTLMKNAKIPQNSTTVIEKAFSDVGLKKKDSLKLNYEVQITGGFFPRKKILKGLIEDNNLIKSIKQDHTSNVSNSKLRDGLIYKFKLSSSDYNEELLVNECDLTETFKKLIDLAEKNNDNK